MARLDIIIPVFNEGENIVPALEAFRTKISTPFRVLICYDRDDDNTLPAVEAYPQRSSVDVVFVKNRDKGPHAAIMTGFEQSRAPYVLVFPADDTYNVDRIDQLVAAADRVVGQLVEEDEGMAAGAALAGDPVAHDGVIGCESRNR